MASFRWNVYLANLDPVIGSEQGKTRPVLVISEDEVNNILPVVNVLPITSRKSGRKVYSNGNKELLLITPRAYDQISLQIKRFLLLFGEFDFWGLPLHKKI